MTDNTNFSDDTISYTPRSKFETTLDRRWKIISYVHHNPDKSAYQISKAIKLSYSAVHGALRELVFARVIYVKMSTDVNGNSIEVFFLPEVNI